LLYVALTRARDRLYLGATLKEGRIQPGRGSLAEVLPHSLLEQLTAAYAPTGVLQWRAASGQVHAFRTVKADVGRERETSAMRALPEQRGTRCSPAGDDFDPLVDLSLRRVAVATAMAAPYGSPLPAPQSDRLVGALVHRLLQRFGFHDHDDSSVTREAAIGMLRPEEAAGVYEPAQRARLSDEVLAAYRIICGRSDLRALYTGGERLHEVRFSMSLDGTWLRGTIDCLIRRGDRLTVLEFKTGAPRDEHKGQLELYRLAAARIFPRCTIDARLVYAETEQRM
jgi:ATP-dependent exoDNAse (exonuclease V) beta subunit